MSPVCVLDVKAEALNCLKLSGGYMSIPLHETSKRSFRGNIGIAKYVVETFERSDVLRGEFEDLMRDLFNRIGTMYGWDVCPAEKKDSPLVLP